jgi:hypothetical protein
MLSLRRWDNRFYVSNWNIRPWLNESHVIRNIIYVFILQGLHQYRDPNEFEYMWKPAICLVWNWSSAIVVTSVRLSIQLTFVTTYITAIYFLDFLHRLHVSQPLRFEGWLFRCPQVYLLDGPPIEPSSIDRTHQSRYTRWRGKSHPSKRSGWETRRRWRKSKK